MNLTQAIAAGEESGSPFDMNLQVKYFTLPGWEFKIQSESYAGACVTVNGTALKAGDSIIFESTTPHRLINKGTKPMRAVWVVLNQH